MINFINQSTYQPNYNYLLIGILGLLVGWLISKLFVNKHWEKRYKKIETKNSSYLTLLDESDVHTRSYDKVVKKLSSQLALLNSDNRTLVKAFTKLQTHRNTLESQLDNSASLFKKAKKNNIELKDKNTALVDKLDIAVKEQHSFKELEESTVDLKTSNSDLQQRLTSSESNNLETNDALKNLKDSNDELWHEYRLLQDDLSSQSAARTQAEVQEKKQLEHLNSKIIELSAERDQLIINAEKHTVDTSEIKTIKENVIVLEKEKRRLNADTLQQKQELLTFVNLQTKFESLEKQTNYLIKDLDLEKHHSNKLLRRNDELQNTIYLNEKNLNEATYQENTTAQEEIKRHENYLLKSETRWASKLNTLNSKIKSERRNHLQSLQKTNNETQATHSKLVAITAKLEKAEAVLEKINTDKTRLQEKKRKESHATAKTVAETVSKTTSKTKKRTTLRTKQRGSQEKKQAKSNQTSLTNNVSKSISIKNTGNGRLKTRHPIDTIKGIGVVYAKRLRGIKVDYVDTLLSKGGTPAGRKSLSSRTDIDEKLIVTWVGQADLLRVDGINAEYAELLDVADISDTTTLRNSNITSLTKKLIALNKNHEIALKTPTKKIVSNWATNASKLNIAVKYDTDAKTSAIEKTKVKTNLKTNPQTRRRTKRDSKSVKVDELTKIKGIGKVNEKLLYSLGIKTFAQISKFTKQDEVEIGEKLSSFHNRITKENWVKQATELLKKA